MDTEKRKQINAKYYETHKDKILEDNAKRIKCKLCNVSINKGSYPLHKKSRLHQSLLKSKMATVDISDSD